MHAGPWNFETFTTLPFSFTARPPSPKTPHIQDLDGGGEAAAGDVGSAQANKWHGVAIGLTLDRLVVEVRPGRSPASDGGGAEAARPRKLGRR
jgi:hypothetical protein